MSPRRPRTQPLCRIALTLAMCGLAACGTARPPVTDFDGRRIAGEAVRTGRLPGTDWLCVERMPSVLPTPASRAERTGYCETSSWGDVMEFLETLAPLARADRVLQLDTLGTSPRGRPLVRAVACAVAPRAPRTCTAALAAHTRPIVWLQANIHGGEVEGKESVQAVLRELVTTDTARRLDAMTVIAVPVYNADGNEALAAQARNREAQLGPARIGERANGQGLDLNRDYIKAEAPETRATLPLLAGDQVDVFVDLHTTNGSYHGYALTWAPSLHPGAPLGTFTLDTLLPDIRARLRRRGVETFTYGNFRNAFGPALSTDSIKDGWYTYDARPRFGVNYFGLTGGIGILSEAYSHDPFARRVAATTAFVEEILASVARDPGLRARIRAVRRELAAGRARGGVVLQSRITDTPRRDTVRVEVLRQDPDSLGLEPGVPIGVVRTGRVFPQVMPLHDRFTAVERTPLPAGGWLIEATDTTLRALLRRHRVDVVPWRGAGVARVERFRIDSIGRAARPFQGHQEVRLTGRWEGARVRPGPAWLLVPVRQPQVLVAAQLLEPRSEDGATTWNVLDPWLQAGRMHPVMRLLGPARRP